MRLAWFTPWPPDRHPAARRSRDAVRGLVEQGYDIDLFVDEAAAADAIGPTRSFGVSIAPASHFAGHSAARNYDLMVYQVGNSPAGAFIWPYLLGRPGLAVLHEIRLYPTRAARAAIRPAAFRAEFAWNHPEASPDAAELAVAGFDGAYASLWPMTRTVIERSRLVAAPSPGVLRDLQDDWPNAPLETIAPGLDMPAVDGAARAHARAALGIPARAVVFGFGGDGADVEANARRLPQVARAFAGIAARVPDTRLLVAGDLDRRDLPLAADVGRQVVVAGPRAEGRLTRAVAAADVWLDLQWPNTGATTDGWLTAIAAGRPTITFDLASLAHVPMLDPRSWEPPSDRRAPIGVAIDLLDEDHSLRLALYRLAIDAPLCDRLGRAARSYWRHTHTVGHMTAAFVRAVGRARAQPVPPPPVGSHVIVDEAATRT
jgi:hypothetical protein